MKFHSFVQCTLLSFLGICQLSSATAPSLKVGFYAETCPSAEAIVSGTVAEAMDRDRGLGAGLMRMHFHDCFVRGCDASILLDSTPNNASEKESKENGPTLRGLEVIDEAKGKIESICPSTVSCADILAFAARDAATIAGGITYQVPAGRRDGRISLNSEVLLNLPFPFFTADQLIDFFTGKGLTLEEMVALSGVHSFGISRCSCFSDRLYNFNASHPQDPAMDPTFAAFLKTKCPQNNSGSATVVMNSESPDQLGIQYYKNLQQRRGLFTSDQTLYDSPSTAPLVNAFARNARVWKTKFAAAMVSMGSMGVLTGDQGEIRKKCNVVL